MNRLERNRRSQFRSDAGAIMLLLAIMLPTLIGVVALAVDISLAGANRDQAEYYARIVALSALEEYTQATCPDPADTVGCDLIRHEAARIRAQDVSKNNFLITAGGVPPRLSGSEIGSAALERGHWSFDGGQCAPKAPPCFIPYVAGLSTVNAYRVRGELYPAVSTRLAEALFGSSPIGLNVLATATLVPREGIFLVDNSRSVIGETHVSWYPEADPPETGPPGNKGHEYAYFRGALNPGYPRNHHDASWSWLEANMPNRGTDSPATDPQRHYADDYRVLWTYADDDYDRMPKKHLHPAPEPDDPNNLYSASRTRLNFSIDSYRDPGEGFYQGPEPLGRIFRALYTAMKRFDEQKLVGDQAGLIFYDQRLPWPRVVKLTSDFDYLKHLTNLDNQDGANDREEILHHGLFPMYNAFTNTPAALAEAYKQFAKSAAVDPAAKSRFIVLFGDGLSNCSCDREDPGCVVKCDNTYAAYRASVGELEHMIQSQLSVENIPIHVIATGSYIAPHTKDIEKPDAPGECYSDSEFRAAAAAQEDPFGFVLGGDEQGNDYATYSEWEQSFALMGPERPFYQANKDLYRVAALTQGLWVPLRPPGLRDGEGRCLPIPCMQGRRRLVDDECRSIEGQMSEAVRRIMGERPYMIVEAQ